MRPLASPTTVHFIDIDLNTASAQLDIARMTSNEKLRAAYLAEARAALASAQSVSARLEIPVQYRTTLLGRLSVLLNRLVRTLAALPPIAA